MNAIQADRESRVLESMTCYERAWKRYVDRISGKLGRSPDQSLLSQSDQFKEKQYVLDFLTKMRPLSELLADSIWYKSLRNGASWSLTTETLSKVDVGRMSSPYYERDPGESVPWWKKFKIGKPVPYLRVEGNRIDIRGQPESNPDSSSCDDQKVLVAHPDKVNLHALGPVGACIRVSNISQSFIFWEADSDSPNLVAIIPDRGGLFPGDQQDILISSLVDEKMFDTTVRIGVKGSATLKTPVNVRFSPGVGEDMVRGLVSDVILDCMQ